MKTALFILCALGLCTVWFCAGAVWQQHRAPRVQLVRVAADTQCWCGPDRSMWCGSY